MKISKQQAFVLDGSTYRYRITTAAIRQYEQLHDRRISYALPLSQVVRALYYAVLLPPAGITEDLFYQAYRKGKLYTHEKAAGNILSAAFAHFSYTLAKTSLAPPSTHSRQPRFSGLSTPASPRCRPRGPHPAKSIFPWVYNVLSGRQSPDGTQGPITPQQGSAAGAQRGDDIGRYHLTVCPREEEPQVTVRTQ